MPSDNHQALRDAITQELEARRAAWSYRDNYAYQGGADLLARHGAWFPGRPLPKPYRHGIANCCYLNAATIAAALPKMLRYVEGLMADEAEVVNHGWCIDRFDRVVDVTPGGNGQEFYLGAVFEPSLVAANMQALGAFSVGLLDSPPAVGDFSAAAEVGITPAPDARTDWPILAVPYQENRRRLPG